MAQTNEILSLINCSEKFDNKLIDIILCNDEPWFKGKDIANILGYSNSNKALRDHVRDKYKKNAHSLFSSVPECKQTQLPQNFRGHTVYINSLGLTCLLVKCRLPDSSDIIRKFKDRFSLDINVLKILYREQETVGQIIEAFSHLKYTRQFKVGQYSIDLFFEDQKIAVECDEYGHKDRDKRYESERQKYIEDTLECRFVRYNPDASSFSIFKVINTLMKLIKA